MTGKNYRTIARQIINDNVQSGLSEEDAYAAALRDASGIHTALRQLKAEHMPTAMSKAIERLKRHVLKSSCGEIKYLIHEGKCYFPIAYMAPWAREYLERSEVIQRVGRSWELQSSGVPVNGFHGNHLFYSADEKILGDNL